MTKSRGLREHHGGRRTKAYTIWCSMKTRCLNPNNDAFANYGGRGIAVSDDWAKFSAFYKDMGDPPPGGTLERIDNNKGYSADNCRWATRSEQGRNKRNNVLVTIDGETATLAEWAERCGLKYATIHQRMTKYGWTEAKRRLRTAK